MRMELAGYVAAAIGMALATSCYAMLGNLFGVVHGGWAIVAIAMAGVFCALVSTSIGELAAMFPSSPGIRTYLRAAFGDRFSIATLFAYLAMVTIASGVEGTVVASVLATVAPDVPQGGAVLAVLFLVTAANILGVEVPRTVQLAATLALLCVALAIGAFAAIAGGSAAHPIVLPRSVAPGVADLFAGAGIAVFLFVGFEWVTPIGRNPAAYRRLIPVSMLLAVAILTITYAVWATAMARTLDGEQIARTAAPQIAAADAVLGSAGRYGIAAMSLLGMAAAFNAGLMGASRLVYGLSREGFMPAWAGGISLRTGVPVNAIACVAAVACTMLLIVGRTGAYRLLGITVAAIECFVYASLVLAVLQLRRTRPTATRTFRTPLPWCIQALIAVAMPVLGVCALVSDPQLGVLPAAVTTLVAGAATLLAAVVVRNPSAARSIQQTGAKP